MPAPRTDIDRDGIAARVALQGVRQTAKATGLAPSTVMDIARAKGVKVPEKAMRLVPVEPERIASARVTSAHASAQPAHKVIQDELSRLGSESRLSAALYAQRTLKYASDVAQDAPEMALADAQNVKAVVGVAQGANVPGFERQSEQSAGTVVNIALLGLPPEPIEEQYLDVLEETTLPGTEQE
jgi:hypothetical protein